MENDEDRTIFRKAQINGEDFLSDGNIRHYWSLEVPLPVGPSGRRARLVQRIKVTGKEEPQGNAFHLSSV